MRVLDKQLNGKLRVSGAVLYGVCSALLSIYVKYIGYIYPRG